MTVYSVGIKRSHYFCNLDVITGVRVQKMLIVSGIDVVGVVLEQVLKNC